jgi:hypothetical protein
MQIFSGGNMSRRRGLLVAVRDRMRRQAVAREAEESRPTAPRRRPTAASPPDIELEQLERGVAVACSVMALPAERASRPRGSRDRLDCFMQVYGSCEATSRRAPPGPRRTAISTDSSALSGG